MKAPGPAPEPEPAEEGEKEPEEPVAPPAEVCAAESGRLVAARLHLGAVEAGPDGEEVYGEVCDLGAGSTARTEAGVAVFDAIEVPAATEPGVYTLCFVDGTAEQSSVRMVSMQIKVEPAPEPTEEGAEAQAAPAKEASKGKKK